MNISIETVKAHLHQARSILETALRPVAVRPVEAESEKGRP
jgi:DNA-binding CsgD family transcriptional regulator